MFPFFLNFCKIHKKTTVPKSGVSKVTWELLKRYSPNNLSATVLDLSCKARSIWLEKITFSKNWRQRIDLKVVKSAASLLTCVMGCTIWYHLYNLQNVKNNHGGVLILVKLQASAWLPYGRFSRFLNCTIATKSRNAPHARTKEALVKIGTHYGFSCV